MRKSLCIRHSRIANNKDEALLQKHVKCLLEQLHYNKISLRTPKWRTIHLGTRNANYMYKKRDSLLERSSLEKDLRVIVDNHLKISSQSSALAKWLI